MLGLLLEFKDSARVMVRFEFRDSVSVSVRV